MSDRRILRLGTGAGFSSDRLEPAIELARDGALDVLVFETIGERTLAFGHRDRRADPTRGYNPHLAARMRAVLGPCGQSGTRIVTNMGVANVEAAARVTLDAARAVGRDGLTVAIVLGDDVTDLISRDMPLMEMPGRTIGDIPQTLICANAYLGTDALLPALETGADVALTGRVADPSLFLAPIVHAFGWSLDDWHRLGQGTLVGHLMECGMQVTGGYFADPGFKDVPRLEACGYPIAEIDSDGAATITKLPGTGGRVSPATVKEQLLYEVHDPARYLTPDVSADFTNTRITETSVDRVHVAGGSGSPRPDHLKATVAFDGGLMAEAEISYAGVTALARAELARDVLAERLHRLVGDKGPLRFDLIGVSALHASAGRVGPVPDDVRVRVAFRSHDAEACNLVLWETEAMLCCGPAGGGGFRGRATPSVVTYSVLVPRSSIQTRVEVARP